MSRRATGLGMALAGIMLVALATWALPHFASNYLVRVAIVMCINAILVASLAVANGFTGVFSLGHVGFVAIGAYASGILVVVGKVQSLLSAEPARLARRRSRCPSSPRRSPRG